MTAKIWPTPKFQYGQKAVLVPLSMAHHHQEVRITDLHFIGQTSTVEYDVRYFLDGKEHKVHVFEDELIEVPD